MMFELMTVHLWFTKSTKSRNDLRVIHYSSTVMNYWYRTDKKKDECKNIMNESALVFECTVQSYTRNY